MHFVARELVKIDSLAEWASSKQKSTDTTLWVNELIIY